MDYAIIGSRTFLDYELLKTTLDKHYISRVVSGGAKGADTLGAKYATEHNIPLLVFLPDYEKYGRKAPFVRNKLIVSASDVIIAFWDGQSTGTKHAINYGTKIGIKSIIINF